MTNLKLNDFEGFDKILFDDHKPDWSKFYDEKNDIFMPPIWRPMTLAQFQLDHYALWMVIYVFKLKEKPKFHSSCAHPELGCYACSARPNTIFDSCWDSCPLDLESYYTCGEDFECWKGNKLPKYAYKIAHILWKERNRGKRND